MVGNEDGVGHKRRRQERWKNGYGFQMYSLEDNNLLIFDHLILDLDLD